MPLLGKTKRLYRLIGFGTVSIWRKHTRSFFSYTEDITGYIKIFYNRQRRQAQLGFPSPATLQGLFYE